MPSAPGWRDQHRLRGPPPSARSHQRDLAEVERVEAARVERARQPFAVAAPDPQRDRFAPAARAARAPRRPRVEQRAARGAGSSASTRARQPLAVRRRRRRTSPASTRVHEARSRAAPRRVVRRVVQAARSSVAVEAPDQGQLDQPLAVAARAAARAPASTRPVVGLLAAARSRRRRAPARRRGPAASPPVRAWSARSAASSSPSPAARAAARSSSRSTRRSSSSIGRSVTPSASQRGDGSAVASRAIRIQRSRGTVASIRPREEARRVRGSASAGAGRRATTVVASPAEVLARPGQRGAARRPARPSRAAIAGRRGAPSPGRRRRTRRRSRAGTRRPWRARRCTVKRTWSIRRSARYSRTAVLLPLPAPATTSVTGATPRPRRSARKDDLAKSRARRVSDQGCPEC